MIITRTVLLASCAFIACGGAARAMSPDTTTSTTTQNATTEVTGEASAKMASISHEMMKSGDEHMNVTRHDQTEEVHRPMLTPDTTETHEATHSPEMTHQEISDH